jgi:hypothetical protein
LTPENIHIITIFSDFEDMNLNTDLYLFNSICGGKDILIDKFWRCGWFKRLGNVYGF